jgi:hypothetical protein
VTIASDAYTDLFVTTSHYTGFENQTDSSMSWSDGSLKLTLSGAFDIYIDGEKYSPTGAAQLEKVIPNVTGLYWIWYTIVAGVPTLNASTAHPGFDECLVATVYWNAATAKGLLGDERHWMGRDQYMHEYLHETVGCRYATGLSPSFTNTTFSISPGEVYDEDIEHLITPAQTTTDVFYKNGSADWVWDAANVTPYKLNGASMRYNNVNALADVPVGKFVCMWLFATSKLTVPLITIIGQRYDDNLAAARANALPSTLALGTLPLAEMKLLYRIIYRQDAGSVTFQEATDYRNDAGTVVSNFTAGDHSTLSNLGYATAGHTGFFTLAAGEIAAITNKASPTTSDLLLIEDAAASNVKKYITIGALPAAAPAAHDLAGALHSADTITNLNTKLSDGDVISTKAAEIGALTEKTTPIGADLFMIEDSADSNNKKKVQYSKFGYQGLLLYADQMASPNNADWAVNALAPAAADGSNNALTIRAFDDTTEEGVGFFAELPAGATNIVFSIRGRAATAPGTAKQVVLKLYVREVPDNAAVTAWSAGTSLTAIDIPTNAYFQYDSQTISLATLGLTAGRIVQFELTRTGTAGSDTLAGDYNLLELKINFS